LNQVAIYQRLKKDKVISWTKPAFKEVMNIALAVFA
jgi:hypothetical protein